MPDSTRRAGAGELTCLPAGVRGVREVGRDRWGGPGALGVRGA